MMSFNSVSQSDLAMLLGVDRGTIRAWQLQGLPYTAPGAPGAKARYCTGLAVHWRIGHRLTESRRGDFSALQKVAIGWLAGFHKTPLGREDELCFIAMMAAADLDQEAASKHLEFARGYWSVSA